MMRREPDVEGRRVFADADGDIDEDDEDEGTAEEGRRDAAVTAVIVEEASAEDVRSDEVDVA